MTIHFPFYSSSSPLRILQEGILRKDIPCADGKINFALLGRKENLGAKWKGVENFPSGFRFAHLADHRNGLRSFEQTKVGRVGPRRGGRRKVDEGGGGLPYRTNRRAVKSIARYFAPPRAASFRREILLTSFRVLRTSPSSLPFSNHSLLSEIHFRRCVEIIGGERLESVAFDYAVSRSGIF